MSCFDRGKTLASEPVLRMTETKTIDLKLNGKPTRLQVDGDRLLLWVLRTDLNPTGTKFGCGEGFCGCCTVLVNN